MGELLGILAGLCFAVTTVGVRVAHKHGATPSQATLMTVLIGTPVFLLVSCLPGQTVAASAWWNWKAIGFFAAAGLIASVIARMLLFRAILLIGPSRANQLMSTDTLFAIATAGLLVGERLSLLHLLGIGLITAGVLIVGMEKNGVRDSAHPGVQREGLLLCLSCAALYAFRNTFARMGLDLVPSSAWGAGIGSLVSLVVILIYLIFSGGLATAFPRGRPALKWCLIVSLGYSGAWICMFSALQFIPVSLVTALKNTVSLFALLLSWLLLGKEERINMRVTASAISIVAGVALVVSYQV